MARKVTGGGVRAPAGAVVSREGEKMSLTEECPSPSASRCARWTLSALHGFSTAVPKLCG